MLRSSVQRTVYASLIAGVMAVAGLPAAAQSPATGVVSGSVTTEVGAAAGGVLVTLRELATGLDRTAFTDRDGRFDFRFLRPGEYWVNVEKIGYTPLRLRDLPVRPGRELALDLVLKEVGAAGLRLEEQRLTRPTVSGGLPGSSDWLTERLVRTLPSLRQELSALSRLSSRADDAGGVEGLPSSLSQLMVDGTPFRPVAHPLVRTQRLASSAFALTGVEAGEVVSNGVDVEWTDAAGGFLTAHSRPGTERLRFDGSGLWGGSVLGVVSSIEHESITYNDVHATALLRTPMLADSARLAVGVELRRVETAFSRAWAETPAAAALAGLGNTLGMDLQQYRQSHVVGRDALSAFGAFDWSLGAHRVRAGLQVVSVPRFGVAGSTGLVPELEGGDMVAGVAIGSTFGSGVANEIRTAVTSSVRRAGEVTGVPHTHLAGDGIEFGDVARAGDVQEATVRLSEALHIARGRHTLKLGAALTVGSYRYNQRDGGAGEFYYGSLDDLRTATGVYVRSEGPAPAVDWATTDVGVFVQNRFAAGRGLELLVGVRANREALPSDVRRDTEWFRLTGIANNEPDAAAWRISPRAGLTWDVQREHRWMLHAGAGVYYDRYDPLLLSQWQIDDGTGQQRRAVGTVVWPTAPSGTAFSRLTLLGPAFEPPRTSRLAAGMTHRAGTDLALHLSGVVRHTENLPRRADVNLSPSQASRDQYDRPVYGTLVKQGGLLAGEPGSGRLFPAYDEVAALNADGWSDHWGITVGVDREPADGVGLRLQYTYSKTTDNWFGGRDGGWTMPRPTGLQAGLDWAEGTSDFDVPHRAVAAIVLPIMPGLQLSTLYRYQSGLAFTPGFRVGVDANADGSARNDPAFVDAQVPGMDQVLAKWSCLNESVGRFAERNSCRTKAVHALDARLSFGGLRVGGVATWITVEALDLLESNQEVPDAALYLIDPATALVRQGTRVTVPLVINPDFGAPLARRESGRTVRLGFSLNW